MHPANCRCDHCQGIDEPLNLDDIKHPLIDVWAVLADPEIPAEVGQRLLTRQRARAEGLTPDVVPEADKPFLARHIVEGP